MEFQGDDEHEATVVEEEGAGVLGSQIHSVRSRREISGTPRCAPKSSPHRA